MGLLFSLIHLALPSKRWKPPTTQLFDLLPDFLCGLPCQSSVGRRDRPRSVAVSFTSPVCFFFAFFPLLRISAWALLPALPCLFLTSTGSGGFLCSLSPLWILVRFRALFTSPAPPPPGCLQLQVSTQDFEFQNVSLPDHTLVAAWRAWVFSLPPCAVLASDAFKTSIAAVDSASSAAVAGLVHHSNSIFTAEALAIQLAITSLSIHHPHVIILSDSLSVLKAIQTWSFKSNKVIIHLLNAIYLLNTTGISVHLVWCPGHRGIPPNEKADILAKHGPFKFTLPKISPEDLRRRGDAAWKEETQYDWITGDYAPAFPHLRPERLFPRWIPTRSLDVTLARWRSRTILTCHKLYRMQYTYSPLCTFCYDLDTSDHILLHCPRLNGPRRTLFDKLVLPPTASYSDELTAAFDSLGNLQHFARFSRLALPHSH